MNIVVSHSVDQKVIGLVTAMSILNNTNTIQWNGTRKPVFDMFAEQKPDYMIVAREDVTKELILGIKEYKPKVIIYGVEVPAAIKDETALILIGDHVPKVITNNIDHNKMVLHKAADILSFTPGSFDYLYESDLGHLTLSHFPKSEKMVSYLASLSGHRLKILGHVMYPTPAYLGVINNNKVMTFLSSVKIYLDNDTNFMLECAYNKTFVLSNVANPLFPHYNNIRELESLISDFTDNEKARRNIVKKAYKLVTAEHTYLDRVIELGQHLKEEQWIEEAKKKKLALV